MKWSIVPVLILLTVLVSCSGSPILIPPSENIPSVTPSPTPTSTPTPSPESTPFSGDWATNQVFFYLSELAKSPEAMRYLADLNSKGWFEGEYYGSEIGEDYGGHKYSGWQVYYRLEGSPLKEYWGNLNWATFEDGYVTEGSTSALKVKADLLELNESKPEALNDKKYETITFFVEAEGEYTFPIYLKNEQTLHLFWLVKEGEKAWFHILTPSGKNLCFNENGQFPDMNLDYDICEGLTESRTIFSPSEFAWGEGYYEMFIVTYGPVPCTIEVNYWIEEVESNPSPPPATTSIPAIK